LKVTQGHGSADPDHIVS